MFSENQTAAADITIDEPEDKIAALMYRIRAKYIPCPQEEKVRRYIDFLYRTGRGNPKTGDSPEIMAIWGPARSGKTRTALEACSKYLPYEEVTADHRRDIMPVLFVRCPGKATMKGLFKKILQRLGVDTTTVGFRNRDENELCKMITDLLIAMKVRLIIIDEFHHLLERTKTTTFLLRGTANALKIMSDEACIPMLFLGLPKADLVLRNDKQIGGRVNRVIHMDRFDWNVPKQQADFGIFIQDLEEALELPEESGLASETNARNIWAVTGGYRGRIARFIHNLADDAYQLGERCITEDIIIDRVDTLPGFGPELNPWRSKAAYERVIEQGPSLFVTEEDDADAEDEDDETFNIWRGNRKPKLKNILP